MFIPLGDNIQKRTFPMIPCLLIGLNAIVFCYQTKLLIDAEGDTQQEIEFIRTWGLTPEVLADGQVLGVMTYMFVHGGIGHILGNMIVLWAFAGSLEAGLGSFCLLVLYLLWGILAGLAHVAMNMGSELPLVGASGAIAGLIGAYTVLYGADARIKGLFFIGFCRIPVQIPAMFFGMSWIGYQLWVASLDPEGASGVAWFAHIGGFAAGAITMLLVPGLADYRLTEGFDGEVILVETNQAPAPLAPTPRTTTNESPVEADPDACPYCRTPLVEATQLADSLLRCGGSSCGRLIYTNVATAAQ
jgi:membrane associated rhomboid family serine protease